MPVIASSPVVLTLSGWPYAVYRYVVGVFVEPSVSRNGVSTFST
jgi:hypothetical protein